MTMAVLSSTNANNANENNNEDNDVNVSQIFYFLGFSHLPKMSIKKASTGCPRVNGQN